MHTQYAAGDVPRAAVAQADAELAGLQAQLPQLQASVRTAALSIGVLLGGLSESELGLLRNAEDAYARTHTTAATDLISLFKALGGGWQPP